jgi:mRNA-degrading endonuclease RelE of RelBE toxin-antitoxin system
MNWKIISDRRVGKEIQYIPQPIVILIRKRIDILAKNPESFKHSALKSERYKNVFRLRVGDYRVFLP